MAGGGGASPSIFHPLPGDVSRKARRSQSRPELANKQSAINFFEEAFGVAGTLQLVVAGNILKEVVGVLGALRL